MLGITKGAQSFKMYFAVNIYLFSSKVNLLLFLLLFVKNSWNSIKKACILKIRKTKMYSVNYGCNLFSLLFSVLSCFFVKNSSKLITWCITSISWWISFTGFHNWCQMVSMAPSQLSKILKFSLLKCERNCCKFELGRPNFYMDIKNCVQISLLISEFKRVN